MLRINEMNWSSFKLLAQQIQIASILLETGGQCMFIYIYLYTEPRDGPRPAQASRRVTEESKNESSE